MWKVPSCCKEEVLTRHIKERVKQKENRKQREDIRVQSFRNEKHDNVFFDASVCKLTTSGGILHILNATCSDNVPIKSAADKRVFCTEKGLFR